MVQTKLVLGIFRIPSINCWNLPLPKRIPKFIQNSVSKKKSLSVKALHVEREVRGGAYAKIEHMIEEILVKLHTCRF